MDRAVAEHVAPWYADQAATDSARLAMLRRTVLGAPPPPPAPATDRITFPQLRQAAQIDPITFRAFWKIMGMIGKPSDVYEDARLVARVRGVLAAGVPPSIPQPTRNELETALSHPA